MTGALIVMPKADTEGRSSLLPFNPADLVAMRVRPADFARMCNVSRQTVSQWIKKELVSLGPDGLLDPSKAARQVMENTNPARLRARVFKLAGASNDELRDQVRNLQLQLDGIRNATISEFTDLQANGLFQLCNAIVARAGEICQLYLAGDITAIDELVDLVIAEIFYPDSAGLDPDAIGSEEIPAENSAREVAADAGDSSDLAFQYTQPGERSE